MTATRSAAPDDRRGQAYALANGGLMLGQGLVYVLAAASLGAAAALWLVLTWRRNAPVMSEGG